MIQHKDIPEAQLHETKGAFSASAKEAHMATGSGTSEWRRINESDISYSDKTKNVFGWNDISDSQYTLGAPLSITASTVTKLTNNAAAAQTDTSRLGAIWSPGSSSFLFNDLNASYLLRVQMKVKTSSAAGTPYQVKVEIKTVAPVITVASFDCPIKGSSYENTVSSTQLLYIGSAVNGKQVEVYITPDVNVTVYDVGFVIQRVYKET